MGLPLEVRKTYREEFWEDYCKIISNFKTAQAAPPENYPTLHLRTTQAVVQFFFSAINQYISSATDVGRPLYASQLSKLERQGVSWDLKSHVVKISLLGRLRLWRDFFSLWLYFTCCGLWRTLQQGKATSAVILVGFSKEMFHRNGNFDSFLRFLHQGPGPTIPPTSVFVCQGDSQLSQEGFWLSDRPLLEAIRICRKSPLDPVLFLLCQLNYAYEFVRLCCSEGQNLLLYKDFPYMGMAHFLNQKGFIEAVITTQTEIQEQKLWLTDLPERKFKVSMLWYSVNSRPFRFSASHPDTPHPNFHHSRCDYHYVWRQDEKQWLESLIEYGQVVVSGPILFYMPEGRLLLPYTLPRVFNAVIFDIEPVVRSFINRSFYSYYKIDHCKRFIEDIYAAVKTVETTDHVKINLYIKPKRPPTKISDLSYHECFANKEIERLGYEANIYDLVRQADLVFVALYSSPMFISKIGKAVYYDGSGMVMNDFPEYPFAQTREQLVEFIRGKIS